MSAITKEIGLLKDPVPLFETLNCVYLTANVSAGTGIDGTWKPIILSLITDTFASTVVCVFVWRFDTCVTTLIGTPY